MTAGDIVCTIITHDYADRALALLTSIRATGSNIPVYVLIVDGNLPLHLSGLHVVSFDDLSRAYPSAVEAQKKYGNDLDRLRWTCKSIFSVYLLTHRQCERVIYIDADCCFFRPPEELIVLANEYGVLLTPHWRPLSPQGSTKNFRLNFLDGLFNGGCIVASHEGVPALTWWAEACLSACRKDYENGLYDDQRYLDLMVVYFPNTGICRNPGYNLADWNVHLREGDEGTRKVPDEYPVAMVHFTTNTVRRIERGGDMVLAPYLEKYKTFLRQCAAPAKDLIDA